MAEHPFSIGQARHDKRVRVERASREFGLGHPAQGRQGLLVLDDHHNRRVSHRVSLDDLLAGSKADLASFCLDTDPHPLITFSNIRPITLPYSRRH